ncbi:kinase-like domain-containing protein [Amylostereum chailletii]|nr:kinase-like domain-containing protein [Amylostereum chailletii]
MTASYDNDSDTDSISSSNASENEFNSYPCPATDWQHHRCLIESRGFLLDTVTDVKQFYDRYWEGAPLAEKLRCAEYTRACGYEDGSVLCGDPGLPDNLFRGRRPCDGKRVIVKAVGRSTREHDITRTLSSPPMKDDPRNHCIPVLDIIEAPKHNLAFIVMEEWSSELLPETPCCLRLFLLALRSCISHLEFMHEHRIAHLDISLWNWVTDFKGHYACIDYELSQRFLGKTNPQIRGPRGTEVPPELDRGAECDPFKVDIWALGVLILRACRLTDKLIPQLAHLTQSMLSNTPEERPSAQAVLEGFDDIIALIDPGELDRCELPGLHPLTNTQNNPGQ